MATFAEDQVTRMEALITKMGGMTSMTIDGRQVSIGDLIEQYEYWQKKVAIAAGTRPRAFSVNLNESS